MLASLLPFNKLKGSNKMLTFEAPVTRSELARRLGVDRTTLWAWQQAGKIPAPVRVSPTRSEFDPAAQMLIAAQVEASR